MPLAPTRSLAAAALLAACSDRPLEGTATDAGTGTSSSGTATSDAGPPATGTDPADSGTEPTTGAPGLDFEPYSLEVDDFDGDGRHDLLVMGVDAGHALAGRLSRGRGDGSFEPGVDPQLHGTSAFPAIGQLDGLGGVDVMIGQPDDEAGIYRWSVGEFAAYRSIKSPTTPRNHVVVDANGDDRNDVIALCVGAVQYGLTLHWSSEAPAWTAHTTILGDALQQDFEPGGLLVGRLDADLAPDVLLFEADAPRGFLRALGGLDGAFTAPQFVLPDLRPWTAMLGDFDEDGALDILAAERDPSRLTLATGDGLGGFSLTATAAIDEPFRPHAIELADLDGDGHLDVLAVDEHTPILLFWSGHGDGGLAAPRSLPLPSGAVRVHAARFDPGPDLDLAVATFAAGDVTVLLDPLQ